MIYPFKPITMEENKGGGKKTDKFQPHMQQPRKKKPTKIHKHIDTFYEPEQI